MVLDCIMSLVEVVLQDMLQALEFVMSIFVKAWRSTQQILEHLMSMFTAVLQRTSPRARAYSEAPPSCELVAAIRVSNTSC